jgi:endonuclease YncB( thermonuclease family)
VLKNARLIPNRGNDGDSFHVEVGRREKVFRLYFVDAPETDDSIPGRLAEQAEYWGVDRARALALGREAKAFSENFLKKGFTVYTRWEDAMGRGDKKRYFAVIRVGETDLSEALVRAGLARRYGKAVETPDGKSPRAYRAVLATAEGEARRSGTGAWNKPLFRPTPPPPFGARPRPSGAGDTLNPPP